MEPVETDWYDDESWADLELATAGTVRDLYPSDPQWVRRWTCYAELMDAVVRHTGEDDEIYGEVADYHLRIYHELLDPQLFATSRANMGKTILSSLRQVIERLTQDDGLLGDSIADAATRAYSREVILAWHYALEYHGNWKAAARQWYLAAKPERAKPESAARVMQDRIWRHGLARPKTYPANSAAALRLMTGAFDDALRQYMYTGAGDDADLLDQLLPACFAERIRGDAEHLKEKRRQYSPEEQRTLGIDENGYTTLMADALPKLRGCIAHKESMLVLGPTSSGKSRIGRIAVCHAITRAHKSHGRAIVLLPTKALVNQAVDEWRDFVKGTYAEQWHILAGSRDYPQNDEAIARREFEIAVMIPEKLAGLMAGGMALDGIDIVIVDELQNLAEEERGPRLEMLLTTIRANYQIPLIGLSATLSPQAIEDVAAWLGIEGNSIVTTRMRPVPLDYIVCDDSQAMVRSADGAEVSRNLDLRSMLRAWRDDADLGRRMESGQIKTYRRALALAATLLRGDGGMDGGSRVRSVLCFVGSREDAQRMADIAQTVLDRDPRTPHVDPEANPFKGRFSDLSDDEARRRYRDFQRYPQTRLRDSVAKSLRTGVGYHTARLDPEMRVEMEEAFRIGLVRLLFATDTLKLGINLPADAVVIASITTPTGERRSRVLNQIDVAQRLGRAGRLGYGLGLRGYGYLVVPEQRPAKTRVLLDEHDLLGLAGMVLPATDHESELDRALRALVDVDAVFKHYIGNIGDTLGASISSRVSEGWFATEILHWAVREGATFTRDELSHRIDALYQASLGRVTGVPAPDHGNVLEFLEKHVLIGPAPGTAPDSGTLVVTGLGRAISTSSLPFDDAPVVEELMQSGMDGAGDLTLLWLATKSGHVRKTTTWISIMREVGTEDPKIEGLQRERFQQLARAMAAPPGQRAGLATVLSSSAFLKWLPDHDLIGVGAAAAHLRRLIYGPGPEPEAAELNALLRACALMLWKSGCPFKEIEDALQTNLEVAVKALGTRTVLVHPQDVRMLGENTSYLFDAARELTGVRPQGTLFRRFEALGESVEFGVPAAIAPLVRLPLRGATHRERVVGLVGLMKSDPSIGRFDSLADVVDRYMRRPKEKPSDPAAADRLARFTLTDQERTEVRKALQSFESRRWKGSRLPRELRRRNVPGDSAYSLEQALEQLRRLDPDNTPRQAALIMGRYGLQAAEDPEDGLITLTSVLRPELSVRMMVCTSIVTMSTLDAARGYADVILACAGATGGVQSAELSPKGGNPVVLQPSILLQAADSVTRIVGPVGSGDGQDMPLASDYEYVPADEDADGDDEAADAESDDVWEPELDDWDEPGSAPAGPQLGFELVGHRLLQLLVAAPPILARNELNRLIAGMTVAAPPALHDDLMVGPDDSDPANLPDEATNGEMP